MTGRPSDYTEEMANLICERIADGESLRSVCDDEDFPGRETVRRWLISNEEFRGQYARAREEQADRIFDETQEIADRCPPDAGEVAKAKLQVDTRKWRAAKLRPKVYGEKLELSGDKESPLIVQVVRYSGSTD